MQSVGASEFNLENLRTRLERMSDEELKQFGKACRDMLTPQANLGRTPREVFVIQLQEAWKEWRRRHPKAWLTNTKLAIQSSFAPVSISHSNARNRSFSGSKPRCRNNASFAPPSRR
jgi:hypothetical protein